MLSHVCTQQFHKHKDEFDKRQSVGYHWNIRLPYTYLYLRGDVMHRNHELLVRSCPPVWMVRCQQLEDHHTGLTLYGHTEQRTIVQQYGDWYWPLTGWLLHLVQRGGTWAGCDPAQSPPRCTKCNSPPINGQCTKFILFDVALLPLDSKGLERCRSHWCCKVARGLKAII